MNKILVLYKSKYGATKKYAQLLKDALPCDVFPIDGYDFRDLVQYDFLILAGGIYASGISCMKYVRKNVQALRHKPGAIFAVGASPFEPEAFEAVKNRNLRDLPLKFPLFYGRGMYDESQMSLKDRTLCKLLRKSLSKKGPSSFEPWMKAFFEAEGKSCDWVDRTYLEPLIAYLKTCYGPYSS